MRRQEEDLVLALYDAKQFINFIKQDEGEIPDNGIEENINRILENYSILRFTCDNYKLNKKEKEDDLFWKMPSFTLHRVYKDTDKHRLSSGDFETYALEKTGWKREDVEFDYEYIHMSKKLQENQEKNWERLSSENFNLLLK